MRTKIFGTVFLLLFGVGLILGGVIPWATAATSGFNVRLGNDFQARRVTSFIARDEDFDLDEVMDTGLGQAFGFIVCSEEVTGETAIFRVDGATLVAIAASGNWSVVKDTASKINIYYEGGSMVIQNKASSNLSTSVGAFLVCCDES